MAVTSHPLGLSASKFVGLLLSAVSFSTPSGVTITSFAQILLSDDRRVRDQLKVLTGLKLPGFNWNAHNMRTEFDIFWETLKFVLGGMEIPEDKWYLYILQQLGREGMQRWTTSIEATVRKEDPLAIIKAFKKGYELEETYWTYRSLYLSSEKQGRAETAAALATRVEDLVNSCKWPDEQKEQRRIDLYYHLSEVFDVRRFVQIETSREGGNLTWEKLVEEAKRQERVGKEYAKFRRENGGGGTPSYGDPALAADAVSRGINLSRDHGHCLVAKEARARSSVIDAEDVTAALARRELVQHGARSVAFAGGRTTTRQSVGRLLRYKQGGAPNPSSRSKGKANPLARMEKQRPNTLTPLCLRRVPSAEGAVSGSEERASTSNSVTSEPSVSLSLGVQRVNSVLSVGNRQSQTSLHTRNVFSCDSIHNTGDSTLDQCKTDTDPSGRLCILADIHVRARTTSRTHYIRVKADPGADTNLMPLHHFRAIFPYLCDKDGKPKEGVLEKAESSFESYSGDNVSVIGQTKIYAKNKQTSAVHDDKDLRDCQRERSHPLGQCSMPVARTDHRASREQGTSCGKVRGSCYQRRN